MATRDSVVVRDAVEADLAAVIAIYTHYVLKTAITFNTAVPNPTEWVERFRSNVVGGRFELLVGEVDGHVAGYVETFPFRPKPAYDLSVETSIYVAPDAGRLGIGSALYDELLPRLGAAGFHRAYAIIALPNDGSVAFHERHGFVHRGTLSEAGRKFGRFIDVGYWEKAL